METLRRRPAAMPSGGLTSTPFPGQSHDERYSFAALCRIVRRPRPCGDGALWEIWAAGASPAGGSTPSGHSAAAVPAGDDGRGMMIVLFIVLARNKLRIPLEGTYSGEM